ncbi:MAG: DUF1569 domain-containing protein [Candidatus Hydrogenedentes bacterium]|nr:DUF1569 domain-containing protein [Candidatus Hydrogenedentota bacterium]
MRHLDHDYVNDLIQRVRRIPADAEPKWGSMSPQELVQHLVMTVKYSMGHAGKTKVTGGWFAKNILGPLIMHGFVKIPRNIRLPKRAIDAQRSQEHADLETFHAVLNQYLDLVQAGEMTPEPHPFFGDIGIDGWDKMHIRHFEHHLAQFGV